MKDNRNTILAKQLIEYSTELQEGNNLYLEIKGKDTLELGKEIIRLATGKGVTTFWFYNDESLLRQFVRIGTETQFKKQAELHLFRMVQQASRNALEHAQANKILIHGTLLPDSLDLHVEDDGVGFSIKSIPDLSTLIANRHFGLANIFERAKIINADVQIESKINKGTTIHIFWTPLNFLESD